MKHIALKLLGTGALAIAACAVAASPAPPPLALAVSTDMPGYTGDFDHFAIDQRGNKLFLAGEESAELEVLNLTTGAVERRLKGYGVPHSLLFMPKTNELLVIDGSKPSQVLDADTFRVKRTYALPAGADSTDWDDTAGRLWIVTGGKDVPQPDSNLIAIDPATGRTVTSVHFAADHVEALAVEQHGPNLFINVTDKNYLAVVDKASGKVIKQWPIKEAEQNAPVAYDEAAHRLFVVTRKPGKLIVLNALTGASIASFKTPERTDQVIWDAVNRRVYVTGGEGYISVVQQDNPDHYREIARIKSMPGAKTAILDSLHKRLWVAVSPGESKTMGKVLGYSVAAR